jgi:acetylornithine/succinyldiaminopimelate/putrescine aminotransferase
VFDEILTGFYRTGTSFYFTPLGFSPDIVLVGKAMGNGFPVSGVVLNRDYKITQAMLPGSTYAGNPLACTAIAATLEELSYLSPPEKVASIERIIYETLAPLKEMGLQLRGRGAMWIIELPPETDMQRIALRLYRRGILMSFAGRILRLLPALTILPERLTKACEIVREELTTSYAA